MFTFCLVLFLIHGPAVLSRYSDCVLFFFGVLPGCTDVGMAGSNGTQCDLVLQGTLMPCEDNITMVDYNSCRCESFGS